MPGVEFVDIGPLVWELRLIKSEEEIALLRRAAAIAGQTMRPVAAACRRGASPREAAREAVASYVELGADPGPPGPISAGRGWDFLHAQLEDAPLADGDVVHVELIPSVGGSARRCAVCIGPDADRQREPAWPSCGPPDRGDAPGAGCASTPSCAGPAGQGLRESFDNISGYARPLRTGRARTSDFTPVPSAGRLAAGGMVFHMYASAAGVSFSETVLVAPDGPHRLTNLRRTLFSSD